MALYIFVAWSGDTTWYQSESHCYQKKKKKVKARKLNQQHQVHDHDKKLKTGNM